jgi:hypothetical protein
MRYLVKHRDLSLTRHERLPADGDALFAVDVLKCRAFRRQGSGYEAPWVRIPDVQLRTRAGTSTGDTR